MKMRNKKFVVSSFFLLFFLTLSLNEVSAATTALDSVNNPQLSVVPYNEELEGIKDNLLGSVSIYNDPELYRRWANMLVSIGIIVLLLLIIRIIVNIITGQKDDLKKFSAFLLLLFFLAGVYAPVFSGLDSIMAGEERFYKDPKTGKEYARIYIPANKALVVKPIAYIDGKKEMFDSIIESHGNNVSHYGREKLGLPAKVVQTQWQSKTDPTNRYSTAFLGVSPNILFSQSSSLKDDIDIDLFLKGKSKCTIEPMDFSHDSQGKNTPMSFLEAISKTDWRERAIIAQAENEGKVTVKDDQLLKYDHIIAEIPHQEDAGKFHSQPIDIPKSECTLGYYLMSNEYLSSLREFNFNKGTYNFDSPSLNDLRQSFFVDFIGINSSSIGEALGSLSYEDQKKVLYTYYAYRTLYYLTQVDQSAEIKSNSGKIKEAILACGRILSGNIQSPEDYKTCLVVDQAGDVTAYTQETSKEIGILGKNKSITEGYILPTPTTLDWDYSYLSDSYGDAKTFSDNVLQGVGEKSAEVGKEIASGLFEEIKNTSVGKGIGAVINTIGEIGKTMNGAAQAIGEGAANKLKDFQHGISSFFSGDKRTRQEVIQNNIVDKEIKDIYGIDMSSFSLDSISSEQEKIREKYLILGALKQQYTLTNYFFWYHGSFQAMLSSISSYDLDGDGQIDREQYSSTTKLEPVKNYYAYHYGANVPTLGSDKLNILSLPYYEIRPSKAQSDGKVKTCNLDGGGYAIVDDSKVKEVDVGTVRYNNETYIVNVQYNPETTLVTEGSLPSGVQFKSGTGWDKQKGYAKVTLQPQGGKSFSAIAKDSGPFIILTSDKGTGVEVCKTSTCKDTVDFNDKYDFDLIGYKVKIKILNKYLNTAIEALNLSDEPTSSNDIKKDILSGKYDFYIYEENGSYKLLKTAYGAKVNLKNNSKAETIDTKTKLEWDSLARDTSVTQTNLYNLKKDGKEVDIVEEIVLNPGVNSSLFVEDSKYLRGNNIMYLSGGGSPRYFTYRKLNGSTLGFSVTSLRQINGVGYYTGGTEDLKEFKEYSEKKGEISDALLKKLNDLYGVTFSKGSKVQKNSVEGQGEGDCDDAELKAINYEKLGKAYPGTGANSARILLDPRYNPPLSYSSVTNNLAKYTDTGGYCLVTPTVTESYKSSFDNPPKGGKTSVDTNITFDFCSQVGEHMRLTDVRLKTYIQDNGALAIGNNKEVFSHISIPLITWDSIKSFNETRTGQNYSGEATKGGGIFSHKEIKGLKITEGDVIVLKPGVILGAYNHPYTILVPAKVLPYLTYVQTDNPTQEVKIPRVYSGGVYDYLVSLISYISEGKAQRLFTGSSVVTNSEVSPYEIYLNDLYDSRPDALKTIEGSVPDRYFHAYYGDSYFNQSEASKLTQLGSQLSSWILRGVNLVAQYRTVALEFLLVFSPLFVFTLLYPATRRIFSFCLALTITLYLLPIIVLVLVNLPSMF